MSKEEKEQFDLMASTLKRIGMSYQTTDELRKNCAKDYGLDYEDALTMAYENMQSDALNAWKRIFQEQTS